MVPIGRLIFISPKRGANVATKTSRTSMEVHRAYRATPNKTSWFRISEKLAYLSKCREKPRFTFNSSSSSQRESQENRGADSTAANVLRRARPLRNQNRKRKQTSYAFRDAKMKIKTIKFCHSHKQTLQTANRL